MSLDDVRIMESFSSALNMERGIYDYQFFYRNLQENVKTRLARFLEPEASGSAGMID